MNEGVIKRELEEYFINNKHAYESIETLGLRLGRSTKDIDMVLSILEQENKLSKLVREKECIYYLANNVFSTSEKEAAIHQEKLAHLTPREKQIFKYLAEGCNNQELAERLHISPNTVKNHVSNILKKLQVDDRLQLIRKYKFFL